MKKLSIFLFVFLLALIKAQTISDYKYVVIPQEFGNFRKDNSYGLGSILEKSLKSKKYIVLSDTKSDWPQDVLSDDCKVAQADIVDDKSMFRNKIILQFKDCKNKVIYSEKSGSSIKDFQEGYQDALKQGLVKIPLSNPIQEPAKTSTSMAEQGTSRNNVADAAQSATVQRFKNGNQILQKIQIDDKRFILVDGNSSVPFASFIITNRSDVFLVKLASGEATVGYFENGNIVIEIPKDNGFIKEVFVAN